MTRFSSICAALATLAASLAPVAASAEDACLESVRALWAEGGPLDPYQRPPHRTVNTIHDADGAVSRVFNSVIETPLRTISGVRGTHMTLAVGNDVWNGPDVDGPWEKQPQGFTGDRRAGHEADRMQRQANLSDVACLGLVERDGVTYEAYSYTTRSDPNPDMGGAWYGSSDTVYVGPESGQVEMMEMGTFVSSWAPEPNGERHVIVFSYDPTIKVIAPE